MPVNDIMVSVSSLTFNHKKYIREAIEGFLMQRTTFPFEVLIHDDASTDGTDQIIKEYAQKFPDIIKPLFEKENQWKKGKKGSAVFNYPRARGKYIALCEGDDYWSDPFKLQKQVDFLEANDDYSMCSHEIKYIFDSVQNKKPKFYRVIKSFLNTGIIRGNYWKPKLVSDGNFDDILRADFLVATNSILFRKSALLPLPFWFNNLHAFHWATILLATSKGKNHHINEVMGVKRKNPGGITQNPERKKYLKEKKNSYYIYMYENLKEYLDGSKDFVINEKLSLHYKREIWIKLKKFNFSKARINYAKLRSVSK